MTTKGSLIQADSETNYKNPIKQRRKMANEQTGQNEFIAQAVAKAKQQQSKP